MQLHIQAAYFKTAMHAFRNADMHCVCYADVQMKRCFFWLRDFQMFVDSAQPLGLCLFIQGKSFIKDALKCMAHGLRHKFSCISRKCVSIKEMVFQLQRECYIKHNLCSAAKENVAVMVEMIHFQDLFPKG